MTDLDKKAATGCVAHLKSLFPDVPAFVTTDEIRWENAYDFVEQGRMTFEAKKHPSHQTEEQP